MFIGLPSSVANHCAAIDRAWSSLIGGPQVIKEVIEIEITIICVRSKCVDPISDQQQLVVELAGRRGGKEEQEEGRREGGREERLEASKGRRERRGKGGKGGRGKEGRGKGGKEGKGGKSTGHQRICSELRCKVHKTNLINSRQVCQIHVHIEKNRTLHGTLENS